MFYLDQILNLSPIKSRRSIFIFIEKISSYVDLIIKIVTKIFLKKFNKKLVRKKKNMLLWNKFFESE